MQKKRDVKKWIQNNKWDYFIGGIWEELFSRLELAKDGVVVEIAPGDVNKLGHGLGFYDFSGTLYVIEPNADALKSIVRKYRKTLKNAKIIPVQKTLDKAISVLPKKVDAIVANHPLDDMILGKSLGSGIFSKYFGKEYGISIKRTKMFWDEIESNKKELERIKSEIVEDHVLLFKKTKPKLVIISQYKSWFFQSHEIFAPDKNGFDILQKLRKKYSKNVIKFPSRKGDLIKTVEDYSRWLILGNVE